MKAYRVAIDIDGVLCDLMPAVLEQIAKMFKVKMPAPHEVNQWDWEIMPGLYFSEGVRATMKDDASWLEHLPQIPWAKEGMAKLKDLGYEVDIVTSRNKDWTGDVTKKWADANFPGYPLYHESNGKCVLKHDVIVDDRPKYVREFSSVMRYGILFDQPWNRDYKCLNQEARADTWVDVIRIIQFMDKQGELERLREERGEI